MARLLLHGCLITAASAAVACWDGNGGFSQEKWPFCTQLASDVLMYYGPDNSKNFMKLGLFVENHAGWSAIALGGNGGMKGAQQFVVRKDRGEFIAEERYSADYTTPQLQPSQEVTLIFASEEGGHIAWGVLVPLTACSGGSRYPIEDVSKFMHWALGPEHGFFHHSRRGQFHANLVSGPPQLEDMSAYAAAEMLMPDVPVVMGTGGNDAKNPYVCGIFDLGQLIPAGMDIGSKHHVAKFSAILDGDSSQYVHHMILYACDQESLQRAGYKHNSVVPECESMPPSCNSMKWPWAVGSEPLVLPAEVGMPFGNGDRWYALQMHYYNPSLDTGVRDSSGVRLTFAPALRTFDAGVFRFNGGTDSEMRADIPAGKTEYVLGEAVVPSECTNSWDVDEVNVVGVVYHAHLVGKTLNIDVVREGSYVGSMRKELLYDFNHQSLEPPSVAKIRRGDDLVLRCAYDTSGKTTPTSFGDFTQTEMCWSAFIYYPAQQMSQAVIQGIADERRLTFCKNRGVVASYVPRPAMPSCHWKGYLHSLEAYQVLASMGVDTTGWTTMTSTTTTSGSGGALQPGPVSASVHAVIGALVFLPLGVAFSA